MSKLEVKLLPHQYELLADTSTKIIGLVSGYGAGKTYAAVRKALQLAFLNPGCMGVITEPTYPLLRDILFGDLENALIEWRVPYKFNKSSAVFTLDVNGVKTPILCRSMENWERLIGINAAWIICDEFDTSKTEIALKAYEKLLGRLRAGNTRQFIITTTPEGFRATYQIFVEKSSEAKRLIKAKTADNKYLPPDFIDTLKEQYPENLLKAYLEGEFVNLTSGTVYSYFSRDTHASTETIKEGETLHIGADFNVGGCINIVCVERADKKGNFTTHAVDEVISYDTYAMAQTLKDRYKGHKIIVYPDASGQNRKTSASETDAQILRGAGHLVFVNHSNPSIKDRVNCVNNLFDKRRLLVNVSKCPNLTKALEQQAWDNKTQLPEKSDAHPANDDYNDALGYLIAYKYPITARDYQIKVVGI